MITQFKIFEHYDSIWAAINYDYIDDDYIFFDAWETEDDNEDGEVIAKIDIISGNVLYIDNRARNDKYAQEVIKDAIIDTLPQLQFEKNVDRYNI